MILLEAALAFAITMLIFSMIATTATEMIHRLLQLRERGLRRMLEQLFDHVLWRRFAQAMKGAGWGEDQVRAREKFTDAIAGNRVAEGATGVTVAIERLLNAPQLASLTVNQFMERLGGSSLGPKLLDSLRGQGEGVLETSIKDMAQKFEALGSEAREIFGRRARLISVSAALLLAFVANIDAVRLFNIYVDDAQLRSGMIERLAEVEELYQTQQFQLHADQSSRIEAGFQDISGQVSELASEGLPVGWQYYPSARDALAEWVTWFLFTLLAGILIGLGAPFWHDAIGVLNTVTALIRRGRGRSGAAQAEASDATAPPQVMETTQPRTPLEVFLTAAEAAAAGEAVGRIAPEGPVQPQGPLAPVG